MKQNILFVLLVLVFTSCCKTTPNAPSLTLILQGKIPIYEKLSLRLDTDLSSNYIDGVRIDSAHWQFPVSDLLWDSTSNMRLYSIKTIDDSLVQNTRFSLGISDLKRATTYSGASLNLPKYNNTTLVLIYDNSRSISMPTIDPVLGFTKTMFEHDYYTVIYPDREMLLSITDFGQPCQDTARQEQQKWKQFHRALPTQYPDSRSLMAKLYEGCSELSIEDVAEFYTLFSDSLRQHSYYGQKIGQLLHDITNPIVNKQYLNPVSQKQEWLITDSTRYNLLIFSASWCAPCQKIIPLLKQIHTDLGDKLAMTYITTEEEKTLPAWQKKMTTENIPWRSLWMPDKQERFEKFQVQGIPDAILVSPDGKMKKLELRNEGDKKLLYKAVSGK